MILIITAFIFILFNFSIIFILIIINIVIDTKETTINKKYFNNL